jgi:hypothetical protein
MQTAQTPIRSAGGSIVSPNLDFIQAALPPHISIAFWNLIRTGTRFALIHARELATNIAK